MSGGRISPYVCPQCGPAPEGADAHAERAHTWPPPDESVSSIYVGAMLMERKTLHLEDGPKDSFTLWVVKSCHTLKNGAVRAKLMYGTRSLTADASATFPGGLLGDDWRLVEFSRKDHATIWTGAGKKDGAR